MSEVFFREMELPAPDLNLAIHGGTHGEMTGRMLEAIERCLLGERPDAVVVYGDTNSTLAGALAAAKLNIPVAHVEAGLRSFNLRMPEELNRILTDRVSSVLFCPTAAAQQNLAREGFAAFPCRTLVVGDVMLDAVRYYTGRSEQRPPLHRALGVPDGFVLCTVHRAENTGGERLAELAGALGAVAERVPVVFPVHPRTRAALAAHSGALGSVRCIEPVGYLDMLGLVRHASVVMTDSGGLQKEAYFLGRPCVTLRDETEWVELVDAGANVLAGHRRERVLQAFEEMRGRPIGFDARLYGDGRAAQRIADELTGA
jgi:UDP-GlcNAc3NAcA epimerase